MLAFSIEQQVSHNPVTFYFLHLYVLKAIFSFNSVCLLHTGEALDIPRMLR